MKPALLILVFWVLSVCTSCMRSNQSSQQAPQANQAPAPTQAPAAKSDRGTAEEARAMLQKAAQHYESAGREQALADFTGKKPPFADRDLFVFCLGNKSSLLTAHGGFPQYVGRSVDVWRDADGKPLGNAIQEAAQNNNDGSIKYRMINPASGKIEQKISFWKKLSEDVCGVGAYNPN